MTQAIDPRGAVAFLERNFGQVSVMAFPKRSCMSPDEPGPNAAVEFLALNEDLDIYFVAAQLADPTKLGKPRKSDMRGSRCVWVDLDPPKGLLDPDSLELWQAEARRRIDESGLPEPHLIIFSGRGLWAFWRLDRELDPAATEEINRALAQRLGGDHCHSIDHVARVPFTRNSKTGIVATVLREVDGEIAPDALPRAPVAPAMTPTGNSEIAIAEPLASLDDLDRWGVEPRTKGIIDKGRDPDNPKEGDDSRSAWLWEAVLDLVRRGVPSEIVLSILLDTRWAISESVYANSRGPRAYAVRQIERAREAVADFVRNDKGVILKDHQQNVRRALDKLGVVISYDEFAGRSLIKGLTGFGPTLSDDAVRRLWFSIQDRFGFRPTKDFFWEAVLDLGRQDTFHPIHDYLDSLTWDGVPRLDRWLVDYGGAQDSPFVRAVGGITLVAGVRRVRSPGVKFDEMPVLEGPQGSGKSTAVAILAKDPAWFSDHCPFNADGREVVEALSGKWIIEAGELSGLRKAGAEKLKSFLSRSTDHARAAYGRIPQAVPRQVLLIGTTNNVAYLSDGTGNRRFWPVRTERFDLEALARDRDQLWAEAAAREAAGASIRLDPSLWVDAAAEQDARRVEDPILSALAEKLDDLTGKILAADVWALLDIPTAQRPGLAQRVSNAMQELGWERCKSRFGGRHPERGYERGTDIERRQRLLAVSGKVLPVKENAA